MTSKMLLAALAVTVAVPAYAAGDQFARIDSNSDGQVSQAEFREAGISDQSWFGSNGIDTNNDGFVSRAEFTTATRNDQDLNEVAPSGGKTSRNPAGSYNQ